jgi:hypothetical protein
VRQPPQGSPDLELSTDDEQGVIGRQGCTIDDDDF